MDVAKAVAQRWSPRAYSPEPIPDEDIRLIFEAGRAAHSCFNEQPFRVLYAKRNAGEPRSRLEALLDPGNAYAKDAWVLGLTFGKKTFTKTGKPNRHSGHDVGSAAQLCSVRAFSLGWGMRFMAGYNYEQAKLLAPADFEPYAMFALGRRAPGLTAPARDRKPLEEFLHENTWRS